MKIQSRLKGAAAPIALSIALAAQPAFAQDETTEAADTGASLAMDEEVIIITGTRIARPELSEPNPIISISGEQIERGGDSNVVDMLVRNPALVGSIDTAGGGGQNPLGLGYTGVNLADLRNLGPDRTLVLVNGKRHVSGVPETAAVDISSIPQDLIERVDVLTGGASAIYGADGVSGVVNFVTKRDFEGLSLRAQTGWTTEGDGNQTRVTVTAGKNFDDDRGNFAIAYEYNFQERVDTRNRNYLGDNERFISLIRNPKADEPGQYTYIPIGNTGWADSSTGGAVDLDFDYVPDYTGEGGVFDRGVYLPSTGGLAIGGSNTPRAGYYGDIVPEVERHIANALFSYEFSPAVRFFAEGKYVSNNAFSVSQPSFDFYTVLAGDNYYLNQTFGDLVIGDAQINRDNFDFGQRGEYNDRETWRAVAGFDGEFADNYRYEISYVYGETSAKTRGTHTRIADRYFAAIDVIDDGEGNPICRIDVDPSGIVDPSGSNWGLAPDTFSAGANSGCVPLNILGEGSPSQAALDWMTRDSTSHSKVTQHVVSGSISGDTGSFFELPGGPIGFAIGAEYRKETSKSTFDDYYLNGWYADSAQFANSSGDFDVKEVFGELNLPILADMPGAELLSIGAAVRLSDYSSVGNTTAWKVDGVYAPISDIRFRGTYSESVRAPNIGELYAAQSGGYLYVNDPCDPVYVDEGTQYRAANCQALLSGLGLSQAEIDAFSPSTDAENSASILGFTSGNPDITEETAKTWTAGVVLRPSFIPRLSFSFDWYNIEIENAITTPTAEQMTELCVDQPTLDNKFCPNVDRDPTTGFVVGWRSGPENVAFFETAGFDATLAYSVDMGAEGRLSTNLTVGYLDKLNYVPSVGADVDEDVSEPYKPQWTAAWDVNWNIGDVTASYMLTWWDKTRRYTTEQVAADPNISDPKYQWYKQRWEHDIRVSWNIDDRFTVYGGMNNLFDTKPDFSLDYPVSAYGRYGYVGVKANLADIF